jgi:signal transduction histidine kinase
MEALPFQSSGSLRNRATEVASGKAPPLALEALDEPGMRRRQRLWLSVWMGASYAVDTLVLAMFGWAGAIETHAWVLYLVVCGLLLAFFIAWAACVPPQSPARPALDRVTRLLTMAAMLAFAAMYPPLAFYFISLILVVLGFAHKRPRITARQAFFEWCAVAVPVALLIPVLGPAMAPPLASPAERLLVAAAAVVAVGRAALFGYWNNELKSLLINLKESYRALSATLEEQVVQRTRLLEQRNRELVDMNAQLQDIAASVAHDFRQPIITISAQCSLLKTRLPDPAQLDRIARAAAQMENLCDGLSRLIAIQQAPLRLETVDVTAMVGRLLRELAADEPSRKMRLMVARGMQAHADADMLATALRVLLANAWKYTADNARASIAVEQEQRGGFVEILVRDNGVGFDPAEAATFFTPFRRLHQSRGQHGAGTDLAAALRIAKRHGGDIRVQGWAGRGACFSLLLPAARAGA